MLSSSSTFCLLKRVPILAALVHYYFFVFWIVRYYFLSFGTCSHLRRSMCNTISPLLAKRCVFNIYSRASVLSKEVTIVHCCCTTKARHIVLLHQLKIALSSSTFLSSLETIPTSSTSIDFSLNFKLKGLFFQVQSPFF